MSDDEFEDEDDQQLLDLLEPSSVWREEEDPLSMYEELTPANNVDKDPLNLEISSWSTSDLVALFESDRAPSHAKSPILSHGSFDPALCVAELYHACSPEEFRQGLRHLEKGERERNKELKTLVNLSASTYISAFQELHTMTGRLRFYKRQLATNTLTDPLRQRLSSLKALAESSYEDILQRNAAAARRRRITQVLQGHKFIFNLPRSLRTSIGREAWEQVITDLEKAKRLFDGTEVFKFDKVVQAVKDINEEVKAHLYQQLRILPQPLDSLVQLISHLHVLDADNEPGWNGIQQVHNYIDGQIDALVLNFHATVHRMESPARRRWSKLKAAIKMKSLRFIHHMPLSEQQRSGATLKQWSSSLLSTREDKGPNEAQLSVMKAKKRIEDANKPARILFAERICNLVLEMFPVFWKLATGLYPQLDDESNDDMSRMFSRQQRRSMYQGYAEAPNLNTYDAQKAFVRRKNIQDFLRYSTKKAITVLKEHLLDAVDDSSLDKTSTRSLLPQLASRISACSKMLKMAGLPPFSYFAFAELLPDLHRFTINIVFRIANSEIAELSTKEDWIPHKDGSRTSLPDKFCRILMDTFQSLKEFSTNMESSAVMEDINLEDFVCEAFVSFARCLEALSKQQIPFASRAGKNSTSSAAHNAVIHYTGSQSKWLHVEGVGNPATPSSDTLGSFAPQPFPARQFGATNTAPLSPARISTKSAELMSSKKSALSRQPTGGSKEIDLAADGSTSLLAKNESSDSDEGDSVDVGKIKQHRLLCVIGNAFHTRGSITQQLTAEMDDLRIDLSGKLNETLQLYEHLQLSLLQELVDLQTKSFLTLMEDQVTSNLLSLPDRLEIRPYVLIILFELVLLHDEITHTAKGFTSRILTAIVEQIGTGMHDAARCVPIPNQRSIDQIHAEVLVFKRVLSGYDTVPSAWSNVLSTLAHRSHAIASNPSKEKRRTLPQPGQLRDEPVDPLEPSPVMLEVVEKAIASGKAQYNCLLQTAETVGEV